MNLLKIQKKIIKKIWIFFNDNKKLFFIQKFLSLITIYIIEAIFIAFKKRKWQLIKIKFLCLLGCEKIEAALVLLTEIEIERSYPKDNEDEIRLLYQSLCNYCIENEKLHLCIEIFKRRTESHPQNLWAWRILLDFNWFLCDYESVLNYHSKFLTVRNEYALMKNYDSSIKYFGSYFTFSIGHICMLAEHIMIKKMNGNFEKKDILYVDERKVANSTFLNYIKESYEIVNSNSSSNSIRENDIDNLQDPFAYCIFWNNEWQHYFDIRANFYNEWSSKFMNPFLNLTKDDEEYGRSKLSSFNVPLSSWFVVIHVRDSAGGSLRNANILDYIEAIKEITDRGGWVIRIGNSNMPSIQVRERFIDLSQINEKDDRLEIFLIASSLFVISTASGPANIPILFGKMSIQTNLIPFRHSIPNKADIAIPVLFFSKSKNRLLTFYEILESNISSSEILTNYDTDLVLIKNHSDDIKYATLEMLQKALSKIDNEITENDIRFSNICRKLNVAFSPKLSQHFLKKYSNLLQS